MLTGKRAKICAFLGSTSPNLETASQELALILTRNFGGVSMSWVQGYWAPDGNNTDGPYRTDGLSAEHTLRIELLVLDSNRNRAIEIIETSCRSLNHLHDLGCVSLHIECSDTIAFHKDIS